MCEGIAKTVKALCDAVGLECIVALSEANPDAGVKYRHTWNVENRAKQALRKKQAHFVFHWRGGG